MTNTLAEARALAARINKEMKTPDLVVMGDVAAKALNPGRLPTGILALDVALGGGFPMNRWSEIVANESAGKTTVALLTVAANQQRDPDFITVWVAAEEFDVPWARKFGIDMDRVILVDTNVMQDAFEITLTYLESKVVDLVVIDSYPALVPIEEDESGMDDWQVGLGARLTGKFFRKARAAGKRSLVEAERPITGLVINQWRTKVGGFTPVPGQDPKTTPGGRAKNYHFTTRIELTRTDWIKDGKDKIGQVIKALVVKNKSAAPQKEANFDFYFEEWGGFMPAEVDFTKDVFFTAKALGVIKTAGAWFSFGDDFRFQGRDAFTSALDENPDKVEEIYLATMALLRPDNHEGIPEEMEEPVLDDPPARKPRPKKDAQAKRVVRRKK